MADKEILKALVGSHAHGLATAESDRDYRGVYTTPTGDLLRLDAGKPKGTHWVEGENEDSTSYELGHFLSLATKCNPSILEVFRGPINSSTKEGRSMRALFPFVWNPHGVAQAFGGYSLNQRKKFLDDHMGRRWKFAVAYIRVLIQGVQLVSEGDFQVQVPHLISGLSLPGVDDIPSYLIALKRGAIGMGSVIETAETVRAHLHHQAEWGPFSDHTPDLEKVNDFLLKMRKDNW